MELCGCHIVCMGLGIHTPIVLVSHYLHLNVDETWLVGLVSSLLDVHIVYPLEYSLVLIIAQILLSEVEECLEKLHEECTVAEAAVIIEIAYFGPPP